MNGHTAGTAGAGYRVAAPPHPYEPPTASDWGWRGGCQQCGRPRSDHERTPR